MRVQLLVLAQCGIKVGHVQLVTLVVGPQGHRNSSTYVFLQFRIGTSDVTKSSLTVMTFVVLLDKHVESFLHSSTLAIKVFILV